MPTHPGLTGADLHVDSGKKPSVTVTTTTYAMDGTKLVILGDTTTAGNDIALTLPDPATFAGYDFEIKCVGNAHHQINVAQHAAENIETINASYTVSEPGAGSGLISGAVFHSDGTNWWVMSSHTNP